MKKKSQEIIPNTTGVAGVNWNSQVLSRNISYFVRELNWHTDEKF